MLPVIVLLALNFVVFAAATNIVRMVTSDHPPTSVGGTFLAIMAVAVIAVDIFIAFSWITSTPGLIPTN